MRSNKMEVSFLSRQEAGIKEQASVSINSSFLPLPLKYVFTSIPGLRGIGPNSGVPLHKPLTGLTVKEAGEAVLSNFFVVPLVTINTIIWENWDIFVGCKYIWKVVRSRPDCVKMFLKDCRCFLCKPHTTKKGKYTAVLLSRFGRVTKTLLSAGTLEEALNACEDRVDEIRFSKKRNVVSHLPVCPDFPPASFFDPDLFEYNNVTNSMPSKARRRSIDYTYAHRDQLEGD